MCTDIGLEPRRRSEHIRTRQCLGDEHILAAQCATALPTVAHVSRNLWDFGGNRTVSSIDGREDSVLRRPSVAIQLDIVGS